MPQLKESEEDSIKVHGGVKDSAGGLGGSFGESCGREERKTFTSGC